MQLHLTSKKKWWYGIGSKIAYVYCLITNPSDEEIDRIAKWFSSHAFDVRVNDESIKLRSDPIAEFTTIHENFKHIKSIGFTGMFNQSKSGKWNIGWIDSDESSSKGGDRESGNGRYVLFNSESCVVVHQGDKLERPKRGCVSDEGIFSLEDWHFGGQLAGTFYVFSKDGDILFNRKLTANISKTGLSDNGLYAACQTANSRTADGYKLFFFDIANKKELFSICPSTGWAERYEFDETNHELVVVIKELGKFRYSADGTFLDSQRYQDANLKSNQFHQIIFAAQEILRNPDTSKERARVVLEEVTRARTLGTDQTKSSRASAIRVQKLCCEIIGDKGGTVEECVDEKKKPRISRKKTQN